MGNLQAIEDAYRERGSIVVSARFDYNSKEWECSVAVEPANDSAPLRQTVRTSSLVEGFEKLAGAAQNG